MAKEKLLPSGVSSDQNGSELETNNEESKYPRFFKDSEISTINDFTQHTRCFRLFIAGIVLLYCAIAGFLIYDGTAGNWYIFGSIVEVQGFTITYAWLLLLPPINFLLVYAGARYILYCILYPYQNSI